MRERHFDCRIFRPLITYIGEVYGLAILQKMADENTLEIEANGFANAWCSVREANDFVDCARRMMRNEEEFRYACSFRLNEISTLARPLLGIPSIRGMVDGLQTLNTRVSSVGSFEGKVLDRRSALIRYTSSVEESRNMCVLRQSQIAAIPTFWGGTRAKVTEHCCAAHGDGDCELTVLFPESKTLLRSLGSAALGAGAVGTTLALIMREDWWLLGAGVSATFFALLSYSLLRQLRRDLNHADEIQSDLRLLFGEETNARYELQKLRERDANWVNELEVQIQETDAVRERLAAVLEEQRQSVRGLSHDMRSPLGVIRFAAEHLHSSSEWEEDRSGEQMIQLQMDATERLDSMLEEFLRTPEIRSLGLPTTTMTTSELAKTLSVRASAFAQGKDIQVDVRMTDSIPPQFETQRLLLDRVIDNLLSNAARYTERGKIDIRLQRDRKYLVVMIRDSGSGVNPDRLREALLGERGVEPDERVAGSIGIGLSTVVRLLRQLGGRLEVGSISNVGTAWWVYLPIVARPKVPSANESAPFVRIQTGSHEPVHLDSRPAPRPSDADICASFARFDVRSKKIG